MQDEPDLGLLTVILEQVINNGGLSCIGEYVELVLLFEEGLKTIGPLIPTLLELAIERRQHTEHSNMCLAVAVEAWSPDAAKFGRCIG